MAYREERRGNRFLYEAEARHQHELHLKRIANARASVDQKPPKGFGELRRNVKREQMTEDRYAKIEHENRLLLSKMSDIMQKGSIDNVSAAWQYGHSLNRNNRKKELERITEANQHILRRIQGVTPYYDHWQWEEEAVVAEKLAAQVSVFRSRPSGSTASRTSRSPKPIDDHDQLQQLQQQQLQQQGGGGGGMARYAQGGLGAGDMGGLGMGGSMGGLPLGAPGGYGGVGGGMFGSQFSMNSGAGGGAGASAGGSSGGYTPGGLGMGLGMGLPLGGGVTGLPINSFGGAGGSAGAPGGSTYTPGAFGGYGGSGGYTAPGLPSYGGVPSGGLGGGGGGGTSW